MNALARRAPGFEAQPVPTKKSHFVTRDETDFLNSLCPHDSLPFPQFEWCSPDELEFLETALEEAFKCLRREWEKAIFERIALGTNAHRVLEVINRKTLHFEKLFEKIPRTTFFDGEISSAGKEIVPRSGLSDATLSVGLRALRNNRAVGCVKAAPYKNLPKSNVFCVAPILKTVECLYEYAKERFVDAAKKGGIPHDRADAVMAHLAKEIRDRCGDLFGEDEANFPENEVSTSSG